jgi:DNA-directed RNA polymerase specialized sigma24 family protein
MKTKTDSELLTEISQKLDSILALLAAPAVQKDEGEVIRRLYENGHSASVIARVVGISENAVAIRLSRMRKKTGTKARANDKQAVEKRSAN